jgi:hypothetical protein
MAKKRLGVSPNEFVAIRTALWHTRTMCRNFLNKEKALGCQMAVEGMMDFLADTGYFTKSELGRMKRRR